MLTLTPDIAVPPATHRDSNSSPHTTLDTASLRHQRLRSRSPPRTSSTSTTTPTTHTLPLRRSEDGVRRSIYPQTSPVKAFISPVANTRKPLITQDNAHHGK